MQHKKGHCVPTCTVAENYVAPVSIPVCLIARQLMPYFSQVLGVFSVKSSKTSLPAGSPLISMSRNVRGLSADAMSGCVVESYCGKSAKRLLQLAR
jgi:hypothetical protein